MFTYKPINSSGKTQKVYTTNKNWSITDETTASYGVKVYNGKRSTGTWNVSDPLDSNVSLEPTTGPGGEYYCREIWESVHQLYYTDPEDTTKSGDSQYLSQQTRELNSELHLISIPTKIMGRRINEGSFTMSNATTTLYDDSLGNIKDLSIDSYPNFTGSAIEDYYIKLDFNDGWKHQKGAHSSNPIYDSSGHIKFIDISNGPYEAEGVNIQYRKHTTGAALSDQSGSTYIELQGSASLSTGSDSFVEISKTADLGDGRYNKDWTVSMWVNIPISQSTTSSYTGDFSRTDKDGSLYGEGIYVRNISDHSTNVIATSCNFDDTETPWEIDVINQSGEDSEFGKIRFIRGLNSNQTIITSSQIHNSGWHHVAFGITGSNDSEPYMVMYIDGQQQGGATLYPDPVGELSSDGIYTINSLANIHIGAQPFDIRQKYQKDDIIIPKGKNYVRGFSGSVDRFRFYKKGLTSGEITSSAMYWRDSNIVGNVFYNHGMATITTISSSLDSLANNFTLNFDSSYDITVHNYKCVVEDGDYNISLNPTVRLGNNINNNKLKGFASGSDFNPYITTIGLYNDQNELLVIGKLAYPVRSPKDIDVVFNIQFDT